ncbi:MAG: hypothetical protein Q9209_007403 [Squamulea sp. 1 TL-2023]
MASIFDESISATGLLGSHFGIPGRPAVYDYVIVGGGTAGLTVARRLAQNSSVAVIEAGDFYEFSNGNLSEVPAYASFFTGSDPEQKNPLLDWYQYTEPQPQLNNRRSLYDSGKVIGGTSARSFLWQIRGSRGAFAKWAKQVGDESYQFDKFLPFFQRSNQFHAPNNTQRPSNASAQYNISDWSPIGGPLQVGYSSWVNPISSWLGQAFTDIGVLEIPSFLSGKLLGWAWLAVAVDPLTQTRSSSGAFLREAFATNTNLIMYKDTLAKQILIENRQAKGVKVVTSGVMYTINARKEVILSAGVMRSPQLLMVSGVGPRNVLLNQGIDVVADRPGVGQNMWDVVLVGPTYSVDIETHSKLLDPEFSAQAVEHYNTNRTGILTNVGGDLAAFDKFAETELNRSTYQALQQNFPEDWPHVVYLVLDSYFGSGTGNLPSDLDISKQYAAASVGLVATFSRGNVSIGSSDTAVNPIVSPSWLSDPRDLDMAVAAFQRGRELFGTSRIKSIVTGEIYPGGNRTTRAQMIEVVKQSANPVYNAVGTNRMGRRNDSHAVVDSKGRVIGVTALRVVDASIFPFLPTSQPSATIFALAEKIAEDIQRDL